MRRNLDDEIVKCSTGVFAGDLEDQVATWTGLESKALAFHQDLGLVRGDHPAPPRVLAMPGSSPALSLDYKLLDIKRSVKERGSSHAPNHLLLESSTQRSVRGSGLR
jgi:hypothetical protein